jgi:hypothetical protein
MHTTRDVWVCATCGVEHADAVGTCAICADERQWVPADGQRWTTLAELQRTGHHCRIAEPEPDLMAVTVQPEVGIGHTSFVVVTPQGSLVWDPTGYVDEAAAASIRARGPVLAVVASHPHMFGMQVQWSRALDDAPVLVAEPMLDWIRLPDPVIESWSGRRELAPGLELLEVGGHFKGASVVLWQAGAQGRGVLLGSDTVPPNPDRTSVTFMRSFPNRIPLSAAVVQRIAGALHELSFDRLYGNFGATIDHGAAEAVRSSARRYAGWVRGDYDALT